MWFCGPNKSSCLKESTDIGRLAAVNEDDVRGERSATAPTACKRACADAVRRLFPEIPALWIRMFHSDVHSRSGRHALIVTQLDSRANSSVIH